MKGHTRSFDYSSYGIAHVFRFLLSVNRVPKKFLGNIAKLLMNKQVCVCVYIYIPYTFCVQGGMKCGPTIYHA